MFYITMRLTEHHEEIQRKFKITSTDNSLVFSWKYPLQWYVIAIPPGDYTIAELNEEIHQRVRELTGENNQVIILFANGTVSITSPKFVIDVYQSSIRTVIGWPEHQNESNPSFLTYGNYALEEN